MKQKKQLLLWLPVVLWMALIFFFSSQAASESQEVSDGVLTMILRLFVPEPSTALIDAWSGFIRKLAHFTLYAVLGMLTLIPSRQMLRRPALLSEAICAAYAVTDEVHQMFVPGRSCQISDMLLDSCGAATGIAVLLLILMLIARQRKTADDKRSLP